MNLAFRPMTVPDFDEFYFTYLPNHRNDTELRAVVEREWPILLRNPTTISLIAEDRERALGRQMVGIAQAVFVTAAFAQMARSGWSPWLNAHAARPLPDGSWPLLSPAGVRAANSGDGLIAHITRWSLAPGLDPDDAMQLYNQLYRAFATLWRGYKIKEIFIEPSGEAIHWEALRTGFHVLNDYTAFYNGNAPPPDQRPCLMSVTRDQALLDIGSSVSHAFAYTPPRFFFSELQQQVLRWALAGAEDEEIASLLERTIWTVHKRWQNIYDRVEEVSPDLLPETGDRKQGTGKRGTEKRRVLLRYLQEHPEELRPVDA